MNKEQFQKCALLYGADLTSWPDEERAQAEQALARDPDYKLVLAEEEMFESLMMQRPTLPDDPSFSLKITQAAQRTQRTTCRTTMMVALRGFLQDLSEMLPMPHPAYVMMALVLVGYFMGAMTQSLDTITLATSVDTTFDLLSYDTQVLI